MSVYPGFKPLSVIAPGICPAGVGCTFSGSPALSGATVTATGTAPALTVRTNIVTAVPAGSGMALGSAFPDQVFTVLNRGANALLVYPLVGAQIETAGMSVGVLVADGGMARLVCVSEVQCYAFSLELLQILVRFWYESHIDMATLHGVVGMRG